MILLQIYFLRLVMTLSCDYDLIIQTTITRVASKMTMISAVYMASIAI